MINLEKCSSIEKFLEKSENKIKSQVVNKSNENCSRISELIRELGEVANTTDDPKEKEEILSLLRDTNYKINSMINRINKILERRRRV